MLHHLVPMRPAYAYLTTHSNVWFQDALVACDAYDSVSYPASVLGLEESPNPYALPEVSRADVTLVDTRWFKWLEQQGEGTVERVFRRLEQISGGIVGVEAYDTFRLGAPPAMLDRCAGLIKNQGLYRDRELYNYDVGPYFPGANWTERRRRSGRSYSNAQLGRLHLSLPCFIGVAPAMRALFRRVGSRQSELQARARAAAESAAVWGERLTPRAHRSSDVHFVGAASHMQRIEAVEQLRSAGVQGTYGITGVPEFMFGLKERGTIALAPAERESLVMRLRAQRLIVPRRPRLALLLELRRHGIVFAPVGFGELTYRHAEAWRAGVTLLCQDLSHAEMMFAVDHGVNAWFCRPDLSDLVERVGQLAEDDSLRRRIAQAGSVLWHHWSRDANELLQVGIMEPITRALHGT